jgi:hypothetical protein
MDVPKLCPKSIIGIFDFFWQLDFFVAHIKSTGGKRGAHIPFFPVSHDGGKLSRPWAACINRRFPVPFDNYAS